MEALATELAKLLNITVDKAIELYPTLKGQFIAYKIISHINDWIFATTIISAILSAGTALIELDEDTPSPIKKTIRIVEKMIEDLVIIFIVALVVSIVCNVLIIILSPDILLIKEFLSH